MFGKSCLSEHYIKLIIDYCATPQLIFDKTKLFETIQRYNRVELLCKKKRKITVHGQ
jgi:hypothetical protein